MGGPVNKAAFTFGIATIAAGNYAPHAAVMAGGMVPPLGIALATTFFRNKFTKDEREAGKVCYIMGLSFITEGAIPFAASDPIRVIPCNRSSNRWRTFNVLWSIITSTTWWNICFPSGY